MAAFPSCATNPDSFGIRGFPWTNFNTNYDSLIVTGSTIGFMGGWALLAHVGKPVSNTDTFVDDTSSAPVTAQAAAPVPLPPLDFEAIEAGNGYDGATAADRACHPTIRASFQAALSDTHFLIIRLIPYREIFHGGINNV